ncbi:MAG: hypothetical protein CMH52_08105 [Myxococcales bacterium]|nr:hypothetical protein [Myxococcales bacterium]
MALIKGEDWAAFRVLRQRLGLWAAFRIAWRIEMGKKRGEPFHQLEPPMDGKELASRKQIGAAILLYQSLKDSRFKASAKDIAAAVIEASAHVFLRKLIGPLARDELVQLDEPQKNNFLSTRLEKIPNAVTQIDHVGEERVQFTVSRCHFVGLCQRTGVPELATLFCAVDESYFGHVDSGARLVRPSTIASGDDRCVFILDFTE